MDTSNLSFNVLLLLERVQISWLPGGVPEPEMALALNANPVVEWYLRHKCPEIKSWLDRLKSKEILQPVDPQTVHAAEQRVLKKINDWLVYVLQPEIYDAQSFLGWEANELLELTDFSGKIVLDIGAGTGHLTFIVAKTAGAVYCVEPVENLRRYLREKADRSGVKNVFTVDGLITEIPFPDHYADITMGGYVFGAQPALECREMERVTQFGGMVILCPGNVDEENEAHHTLVSHGYQWSRFLETANDWRRKYWRLMTV